MPGERPVGTGVSWGNTSALPSRQAEEPLQEVTLTLPTVQGQSWDLDGACPALQTRARQGRKSPFSLRASQPSGARDRRRRGTPLPP